MGSVDLVKAVAEIGYMNNPYHKDHIKDLYQSIQQVSQKITDNVFGD